MTETPESVWSMGELAMWVHLLNKREDLFGNKGETSTMLEIYQSALDLEIEKFQTKHQSWTLEAIAAEVDKIKDYVVYTKIAN